MSKKRMEFVSRSGKVNMPEIFLTEDEAENQRKEYKKIIKNNFPKLKGFKPESFRDVLNGYRAGDDKSREMLFSKALGVSYNFVIKTYTDYDMTFFPFEDMISDLYIVIEKEFDRIMKYADFYTVFEFAIKLTTCTAMNSIITEAVKKNYHIAHYIANKEQSIDL